MRLERGRIDEAEQALKRALAVRPDYPVAFRNLARVAAARGEAREREALELVATRLEAMQSHAATAEP